MSRNLYLMQFYEGNVFWIYTVFNKYEMIKIGYQTRENSQVLSQVLEYFCCGLYVRFGSKILSYISQDVFYFNKNQGAINY